MGQAKRRGSREERVLNAIERNKRDAEEREEKRQLMLEKQREEYRLQKDKENGVINYLIENALQMELDKIYILDVEGEEVTVQPKTTETFKWYRVNFSNGREVIDYEIIKEENGEIYVNEVKDSRLSVRKEKQHQQRMALISAMSSMGSAYERGIYGR